MKKLLAYFILALFSIQTDAQVVPDTLFQIELPKPAFIHGKGPHIYVDAAHNNYHTIRNRYAPFKKVLEHDGFVVKENNLLFNTEHLKNMNVLVISNALHASNLGNWQLPTPSAFTQEEMEALHQWVSSGGRLFLIADHMPFSGAAQELAKSFGVTWCNCFAMDNRQRDVARFISTKGQLKIPSSWLLRPDTVASFTGSAIRIPKSAIGIIELTGFTLLSPMRAWEFREDTPFLPSTGWFQLAVMSYGKGKIIFSGEAAMFSAQRVSGSPAGFNHEAGRQNAALLLALMRWLTL